MTDTWLLYDDGVGGHHPGYVERMVDATQTLGLRPVVASPIIPSSLLDQEDWIPVGTSRLRQVVRNWARMATTVQRARRMGADAFVDLFLDKNIWPAGAARQIPRRLHILHRAEQYNLEKRHGAARVRTELLRGRIRRLTSKGAVVVVHTGRAAEIMGSTVAPDRLLIAPLPVDIPAATPRSVVSRPPVLLFAGSGRVEKGLDRLLEAVATLPRDQVSVRIVGSQPDGLVESLGNRFPAVAATWIDRFVSHEELQEEYREADLVVLPYRREFGEQGGASSVLLEVLAHGRPLVTTPALESQLPAHKLGCVVACSDSAKDVADAIGAALSRLDEIAFEAAEAGPRFIAENHGYDAYVRVLQDALAMTN